MIRTAAHIVSILSVLEQHASAKLTEASYFYNSERPLVVSHRGSSGHFPEHSIPGYTDAFYGGADFLEQDLQISADGQLIVIHDAILDTTTDVEDYGDLYGDRKRSATIPQPQGAPKVYVDSYFVHDFTLEEIKGFRQKQRYSWRSHEMDGKY